MSAAPKQPAPATRELLHLSSDSQQDAVVGRLGEPHALRCLLLCKAERSSASESCPPRAAAVQVDLVVAILVDLCCSRCQLGWV
jgi:hypothetical protein